MPKYRIKRKKITVVNGPLEDEVEAPIVSSFTVGEVRIGMNEVVALKAEDAKPYGEFIEKVGDKNGSA